MIKICVTIFFGCLCFFAVHLSARDRVVTDITLNEDQNRLFIEYVNRLQDYPDFETSEKADGVLEWEYSTSSDLNLKSLVEKYGLNDVAGQGTEVEKWLHLMDWVHRQLFRVGKIGYPRKLNTPSILDYVKKEGTSVNCRMYSIVLNEILLALGYHSRRISFRPSLPDGDTHSLVMVYNDARQKWICLDPTFNTYFHDDSGEILGYSEIRESYGSGKMPRFRPIAISLNWTLKMAGCEFDSYDAWYAVYMAKNCFQVACPLKSAYGHESSKELSWVWLLPSGFQSEKKKSPRALVTSNLNRFFRKPH